MKIEEVERLKGKTVNVWEDPVNHKHFLGRARVTSILRTNELENTVFVKVKFRDTGKLEKHTLWLGERK